MQIAELQHCE